MTASGVAPAEEPTSPKSSGGVSGLLDRFQQRHPGVGFPLAVIYKYFDDSGAYLSALITYYAFVSLFPLLLLLATFLGIVLDGNPGLQNEIIHSAAGQFPVVGKSLADPKHLSGGAGGIIVGLLGSLYGGLGVAQAAQYAMNTAWSVPRNSRPNPFKARGRSLLLLATVGLGVIGTTVLSIYGASDAGSFGMALKIVVLGASVLINAAVFVLAFRIATAQDLSIADVAPGAIIAAVAWQVLQTFGVTYVTHVVKGASESNGVFALVLGLIAFLYLASVVVVLCIEINVVRVKRLHPRSLLTPFTDDVVLTGGDRRAYIGAAEAQRHKGFETIEVSFDQPSTASDDGPGPSQP